MLGLHEVWVSVLCLLSGRGCERWRFTWYTSRFCDRRASEHRVFVGCAIPAGEQRRQICHDCSKAEMRIPFDYVSYICDALQSSVGGAIWRRRSSIVEFIHIVATTKVSTLPSVWYCFASWTPRSCLEKHPNYYLSMLHAYRSHKHQFAIFMSSIFLTVCSKFKAVVTASLLLKDIHQVTPVTHHL